VSDDVWAAWREARPQTTMLHLDTAAVGRSSIATLEAVAGHARLEAEVGGYVAEERAAPELDTLRRDVAGLLGTDAEGVAFVESAMAALDTLVQAWPLQAGARVLVAASEWGPNLELLDGHGLSTEQIPVDADGVIDLEALARRLEAGAADAILVDQVAAHRGLVQPAADVLALAQAHGVPVWLDAAQSVGQVVVPPGVDAVIGTSRKWLTGPRGVGMLAVAEQHRQHLRVRRPAKHPDRPTVQQLESDEAHVAGRIGLRVAVREHLELSTEAVAARLVEVGRTVREMAAGLAGWEVVHPNAPAASTTALRPTAGQDAAVAQDRLLDQYEILTSLCLPWRAPGEAIGEPWLRLSPHVDLTVEDLERTAAALSAL
jgi:pyridoxal 5-phosphate dependent beta-lyase